MKEDENIPVERIEAYLDGTLSPAEKAAFESEMAGQPAWQDALNIQRELRVLPEVEKLQVVISQAEQDYFQGTEPKTIRRRRWPVLLAAAMIGLLIMGWWLSREAQTALPEDFLQPYPSYSQVRSDPAETLDLWALYDQGKYKEALDSLQNKPDFVIKPRLQFYAGNCALMLGKTNQAISLLLPLAQTDASHPYVEQASWYLGLAYWQKGEIEKARNSLRQIRDSGAYGDQIKEILPLL